MSECALNLLDIPLALSVVNFDAELNLFIWEEHLLIKRSPYLYEIVGLEAEAFRTGDCLVKGPLIIIQAIGNLRAHSTLQGIKIMLKMLFLYRHHLGYRSYRLEHMLEVP